MNIRLESVNEQLLDTVLSNDENKLFEERLQEQTKELTSKQLAIEKNLDRVRMLEEHQKLIDDELRSIQRLLAARRSDETTERPHLDIDIAEARRLERSIVVFENELNRFTKRKNAFQTEMKEINTQIERIISETSIEQETFERIINALQKQDDETFHLMKYTRQDDSRIKDLTAELERQSERSLQLKRTIAEETIDYASLQNELDKFARTFRRSHTHRQELIHRWESLLAQMQRKDLDIDSLAIELVQMKAKTRSSERDFNEQKLFHERETKGNHDLERFIDLAQKTILTMKDKQKTSMKHQEQLDTDSRTQHIALAKTQNQLECERAFNKELTKTISIKRRERTKDHRRFERILERKRLLSNEKITNEEKLIKFEKLAENEQKYQTYLNDQHRKLTGKLFSLNNDVMCRREHEEQIGLDNRTWKNYLHAMRNQIKKLDQQLIKQQEMIYHQDFLKQSLDRRVNRILSEKNNVKSSDWDAKVRQLRSAHETKRSQYDQLQNQMKILTEELRTIKRDSVHLTEEKSDLEQKLSQFDLYITLSEKRMRQLNTDKEDHLVEEHFLHVELNRLKNSLHNSNETNLTLEQQRLEIQKAIKERRLKVHMNCHRFQIRFNDERTKKVTISTELAMRVTRITKLKHRYETFAMTLNTEKSDEENVLAQAQYVIQSAQMKEELLRKGDQLEVLVIKAERELRALENTVQILQWNNVDVKKTFEKLNETSPEIQGMDELEEHYRAVTEQVRIRRKLLKDLTEKNDPTSSTTLNSFAEEIEQTNKTISNKRSLLVKLEHELEQNQIKITRADQLIERLERDLGEHNNFEENELDIRIRLQRQTNQMIEQQLISRCLSLNDSDVIDILEQLSAEQGSKLVINRSTTPLKRQHERVERKTSSSSRSTINVLPNLVNISIDGSSSRSSTSESIRSSKTSRTSS